MRYFIFLTLLAVAASIPSFYNNPKDIRIDDDQIVISNGQGKRILIRKPTDQKTKQVEVVIAGQDGVARKITIDKNMQVIKDVKSNEETSSLLRSFLVKHNASNVTDSQFSTLVVIFKEYQGIINGVTYEQLLGKLHEAVINNKIHEVVYEALMNFDSENNQFNPMTGSGLGRNLISENSNNIGFSEPQPPMYAQQYPMYNHQTFNWNQLSQQYGANYLNHWPQQQSFDSNNLEMLYQYSQNLYQTLKQTMNYLKQLEQQVFSHFNSKVYDNQLEREVSQLYNVVEQNFERVQSCKLNPNCVNYFGKNWYALSGQQTNYQSVYGQQMNAQSVYGQQAGLSVYEQPEGQYGQQINRQPMYGQQNNGQPIYGQQIDVNQVQISQLNIDQVRALRLQLIQQSQPLLQKFKSINQELFQLVSVINQQQSNATEEQWNSWLEQVKRVYYRMIPIVSQELNIQQRLLQIHEQMRNLAEQLIPNYVNTEAVSQISSSMPVQQQWPANQQQWPGNQQQWPVNQQQWPVNQQQWPVNQQQSPLMQNSQPPILPVQPRIPMLQNTQPQGLPVMQNNMMMARNRAQWPISYNM